MCKQCPNSTEESGGTPRSAVLKVLVDRRNFSRMSQTCQRGVGRVPHHVFHEALKSTSSETSICSTAPGQSICVSPHGTSFTWLYVASIAFPYLEYALPVLSIPTVRNSSGGRLCLIFRPNWCGGTCRLPQGTGGGQQ